MILKRFSQVDLKNWIVWFSIAMFSAALAFFGYIGTFTRFWADDYCYSALIKQYGYFEGIAMWYKTSGNRFSTIATIGIVDLFGPRYVSAQPIILFVLWVVAWIFFLNALNVFFQWRISKYWFAFIAVLQVYFTILLAPDRLQSIYWRMATLHYSFPMPFLMVQLGWMANQYRKNMRISVWMLILNALFAFYVAGQSEPPAIMQVGVFSILILVSWFLLKGSRRVEAIKHLAAPLVGTLLGTLVLFISPYNANRVLYTPPPSNPLLVIPYSFRYVLEFFFYSIRGQVIPFAVLFIACFAVSTLILANCSIKLSLRVAGIGFFLSLVLMVVLAAFSFAPSAYANLAYPGGRALMPGCFILLAGLGMLAFFAAAAVFSLMQKTTFQKWVQLAALLLMLASSLYPVRQAKMMVAEKNTLAVWAARWDARDQSIRQAKANGELDLHVKEFEVVRTLEDMGPNPYHWINACAAVYYGVHTITATP